MAWFRLACLHVEVDIDSLGTVFDGVAFLPVPQRSVYFGLALHIPTYLSKPLPVVLDFWRRFSPLFTNDLRYLWICKSGMLSDDLGLVMLPVKDKGYKEPLVSTFRERQLEHPTKRI